MDDDPRDFEDLPLSLGDALPWAELSDADLFGEPEADNWIGNLAVLVAILERVISKQVFSFNEWQVVRVCMGDTERNAGYRSASKRQLAERWQASHKKRGLWEDHFIPDGPSAVGDIYTFQTPKYGFDHLVPVSKWTGWYRMKYRTKMAAGVVPKVDTEGLYIVGRLEYAKFILNDVILKQRRYVSAAISDGYPSLFAKAAPKVQAIFDVQAAAGHKGNATGAKMALRSMLLLIGAEDPGRAVMMLSSIKRTLGYEVIGYEKVETLSFSMAVHEMAVTMAQRNPDD